MRYQFIIAGDVPIPLGPRDLEATPEIGAVLTEDVGTKKRQIEVVAVTHLPVIAGGTFDHHETWVIFKLI